MAYKDGSLVLIGSAPLSTGIGNAKSMYLYVTDDAVATVIASGYFNNARNRLSKGDLIEIASAQATTPVPSRCIVTAVPASADITVATVTDDNGISGNQTVIAALTDSSGGSAGSTLAAGVGKYVLPLFVNLAELANGDVLTEYVPGHRFKVLKVDFRVEKAVTTAAKLASLNLEIETTNVTGGVVALTSDNCTPKGAAVAGTAVTAANIGTATEKLSVEAASVTAFSEGTGWLLISIQNMDTADAIASLAAKIKADLDMEKASGLLAAA